MPRKLQLYKIYIKKGGYRKSLKKDIRDAFFSDAKLREIRKKTDKLIERAEERTNEICSNATSLLDDRIKILSAEEDSKRKRKMDLIKMEESFSDNEKLHEDLISSLKKGCEQITCQVNQRS